METNKEIKRNELTFEKVASAIRKHDSVINNLQDRMLWIQNHNWIANWVFAHLENDGVKTTNNLKNKITPHMKSAFSHIRKVLKEQEKEL